MIVMICLPLDPLDLLQHGGNAVPDLVERERDLGLVDDKVGASQLQGEGVLHLEDVVGVADLVTGGRVWGRGRNEALEMYMYICIFMYISINVLAVGVMNHQ